MYQYSKIPPSTKKIPMSFRSLFWFDLITLTFHENSNHGRENYWKSGVQIPAPESQNFLCPFSVHFEILHKNYIIAKKTWSPMDWMMNKSKTSNVPLINLIRIKPEPCQLELYKPSLKWWACTYPAMHYKYVPISNTLGTISILCQHILDFFLTYLS